MNFRLKNDIRERVYLLSIIPMLMITLLLGVYFTYNQINTAKQSMFEKGHEFTKLLAAAAEFGVLSNNAVELEPLSNQLIENPFVKDVIFMDQEMQVIHRKDSFALPQEATKVNLSKTKDAWWFSEPIRPSPIQISSELDDLQAPLEAEIIGWVLLVFSDTPIKQQQYTIIRNSTLILLAGFLFTFVVSNHFGKKISVPVKNLSLTIGQLRRGNLGVRATGSSTQEFMQLAEGINELAKSLEESHLQMEARITQATQALSLSLQELGIKNNQLIKAHQKANNANRAKDAFLARMSHELRTPLTSVIGFTKMMQDSSTEQEKAHYLKIIDHTSQVLLTLIDDLLDFTRLEADAIQLETISFNPELLLSQTLEMHALTANSKGLELILDGTHQLPSVLVGDPTRIRQIITNLVSNAIKFTDSGHVRLYTQYNYRQKSLQIRVEDTGIGINPNYVEKLFESFTQADNSISRKYGGSGLGLAIVSRLANLMQGEVTLEHTSNQGTTFVIHLPISQKSEPFELDELEAITPPVLPSELKVLVIDPYWPSLQSISQTLGYFGIEQTSVHRIEEALNQSDRFSHIIVNHLANNHDMERLQRKAESLRQQFPNAKLMVLLPASIKRDAIKSLKARYLAKPLSSSQLINGLINSKEMPHYADEHEQDFSQLDVLIVEDNDYNRLLVKRILNQIGIQPREATTGKQAIDCVTEKLPDLTLMDINMPDMDGITASSIVLKQHPKAKIVALTANISSREQQMLSNIGIDQIILKPLNIEKLYQVINTLELNPNKVGPSLLERSEFHEEIKRQLNEIQLRIYAKDYESLTRNAHQLNGFAGLFDQPEIELVAERLKKAVLSRDIRNIWSAYNQLSRVVNNIQRLG